MKDIRMDAYYYGFDKTHIDCIDELLSCVACAGKAFHNTSEWLEESSSYGEHTVGKTPIEWIQNSAIKAANEITSLRKQLEIAKQSNSRWISVKDRLPENRKDVLCSLKHSPQQYHIHDGSFNGRSWRDGHGFEFFFRVTHWQPLPEPPKD